MVLFSFNMFYPLNKIFYKIRYFLLWAMFNEGEWCSWGNVNILDNKNIASIVKINIITN